MRGVKGWAPKASADKLIDHTHAQGIPTTVLLRKQEDAQHINTHRRHPHHLSDMTLSEHITASADPKVRVGTLVCAVCLVCM